MSKKDYTLLAEAFQLALLRDTKETTGTVNNIKVEAWKDCVRRVCNALEQDNPRFNRKMFCDACGWEP